MNSSSPRSAPSIDAMSSDRSCSNEADRLSSALSRSRRYASQPRPVSASNSPRGPSRLPSGRSSRPMKEAFGSGRSTGAA